MLFSLWLCSLFPPLYLALAAYLAWTFAGSGLEAARTGNYPTPLRRWGMWRAVAGYFPARLHKTADLPPGKPCEEGSGACLAPAGAGRCNVFSAPAPGHAHVVPAC